MFGTRPIGLATSTIASSTTSTSPTEATGDSHIGLSTGESGGLEPDERLGTEPAGAAVDDLESAAEATGCELQLDLPEHGPQGNLHIPASQTPQYSTEPPNSSEHDTVPL